MRRWLARLIGMTLTGFGILGMLTPIPFGLIFFVIGLLFLIPSTPAAAGAVRWARGKIGLFDRAMHAATDRMPHPYRRILKQTEIDITHF